MTNLVLRRLSFNKDGTPGVLLKDGVPIAATIERPWIGNKNFISCIPPGAYDVGPNVGAKGGFRLANVPGRTDVLIHVGNTIIDTLGCILVGASFNGMSVTSSTMTLAHLVKTLPKNFKLTILNP